MRAVDRVAGRARGLWGDEVVFDARARAGVRVTTHAGHPREREVSRVMKPQRNGLRGVDHVRGRTEIVRRARSRGRRRRNRLREDRAREDGQDESEDDPGALHDRRLLEFFARRGPLAKRIAGRTSGFPGHCAFDRGARADGVDPSLDVRVGVE